LWERLEAAFNELRGRDFMQLDRLVDGRNVGSHAVRPRLLDPGGITGDVAEPLLALVAGSGRCGWSRGSKGEPKLLRLAHNRRD
jgi:hypothetical protein